MTGLDIDQSKIDQFNHGRSYIKHIAAKTISEVLKAKRLTASTDLSRIKRADAVIICVPTPPNDHREPDILRTDNGYDSAQHCWFNVKERSPAKGTAISSQKFSPVMNREEALQEVLKSFRTGTELRNQVARNCGENIVDAAALITQCLHSGGKLLFFGNGGSAADAQRLAAEFVGRFQIERYPLRRLP